MIIGISGWQDTGKTLLGRVMVDEIIDQGHTSKLVGNLHCTDIKIENYYLTTSKLVDFIKNMIPTKRGNTLIFFDEADRGLPARFWKNEDQTMALVGLWQDEKMYNDVIYTYHRGIGVDKILRVATSIEIRIIDIDKKRWSLLLQIEDWRKGLTWQTTVANIDRYFKLYNRWEVVV